MAARPTDLPDISQLDADALRALVLEQHARLQSRETQIEHLLLLLAKLKRMQFGRSSEKIAGQIEQLELCLEELQTEAAEPEPEPEPVAPPTGAELRPRRKPLPAHLRREVRRHEVAAAACPRCGGEFCQIGEDVSEVLELIPAEFVVVRHVRPKLGCKGCAHIMQAPAASRPIERGLAGPGLLAHVLASKYADHLPLHRQEVIYARSGVEIERSTLAGWVGGATNLLTPLVDALRRYVLQATKVHGDDTPVPVLAPGLGKTRTGRLWAYVRDDRPSGDPAAPAVWFAYSSDRKGEHPARHLANFQGTLQADRFAGFNQIYAGGKVREAACWAHVRRKFFDLESAHHSPIAGEAMRRIAELYAIEAEIRGRPPEQRRAERQARAAPRLTALHNWLLDSLKLLSRHSDTARAVNYALSAWDALVVYRDDGQIEMDNNAVEREIRAVALGRKNYLFAGSDAGGERAAAMYSLMGSAKLNGLDPEAYLRQVLERMPEHPVNRIAELLPWNIQPCPKQS